MEPFQFDYFGYLRNMAFLIILLGAMSYILVKLKSRDSSAKSPLPRLPFLGLNAGAAEVSQIEVIERKVLEPRKTLYLVRVFEDQYWLLGTTDTQIEALGQIQPARTLRENGPNKVFSDYLESHETNTLE